MNTYKVTVFYPKKSIFDKGRKMFSVAALDEGKAATIAKYHPRFPANYIAIKIKYIPIKKK